MDMDQKTKNTGSKDQVAKPKQPAQRKRPAAPSKEDIQQELYIDESEEDEQQLAELIERRNRRRLAMADMADMTEMQPSQTAFMAMDGFADKITLGMQQAVADMKSGIVSGMAEVLEARLGKQQHFQPLKDKGLAEVQQVLVEASKKPDTGGWVIMLGRGAWWWCVGRDRGDYIAWNGVGCRE